jgi:hypothetical protein
MANQEDGLGIVDLDESNLGIQDWAVSSSWRLLTERNAIFEDAFGRCAVGAWLVGRAPAALSRALPQALLR